MYPCDCYQARWVHNLPKYFWLSKVSKPAWAHGWLITAIVVCRMWLQIHVLPNSGDLIPWAFPVNCPQMNAASHLWWINIGSGNDFVSSGNKQLPELILAQINTAVWHQYNVSKIMTWAHVAASFWHKYDVVMNHLLTRCHIRPILVDHDDVIKWKHFPRNWPFVRGIHWSPVNSPHKGHWRGASLFSLICARINGCVNNGEAGDLRSHRAHNGVIVMTFLHDR